MGPGKDFGVLAALCGGFSGTWAPSAAPLPAVRPRRATTLQPRAVVKLRCNRALSGRSSLDKHRQALAYVYFEDKPRQSGEGLDDAL